MITNIDEFEKTVCDKPIEQPISDSFGGYGGPNPDAKNKIKPLEQKARAMLYAAKWGSCAEGGRNNAAYAHACQLREFDLSEADAFEILADWNKGNRPPLPEAEIRKAFGEIMEGAKKFDYLKYRCKTQFLVSCYKLFNYFSYFLFLSMTAYIF